MSDLIDALIFMLITPCSPHTLPATSLYLSHLQPSLNEQQAALTSRLAALHTQNEELLVQVKQQRSEVEGLLSGLERVASDLDASVAVLPHDELLALTSETVAMDEEMRMDG